MSGAVWAAAIWTLLISVWAWRDRRVGRRSDWLNRENIAIVFALLGTLSLAQQTAAEELLRNPVVAERVVRGGLAALSLLISGPVLVSRLRRAPPMRSHAALTALIIYLGVALITVLYSVAPLVTAAKAFELGAGLSAVGAAALAADASKRLQRMVTFVIALEGVLLATAVLGFFLLPDTFAFVDRYRTGFIALETMTAPFSYANALSATAAILATYAIARLLDARPGRQRAWWIMVIAVAILGALLASGRQGIVMLAAGAFTLLWFRRRTLFLTLIGPAAAAGLWMFWDQAFRIFSRGQPQLLSSLTGRVPWWEAALEAWSRHPWTGYGYGAGGRFVSLANIGQGHRTNVHSGYIESLVGVGLLGFIPLLVAIGLVVAWSIGALRKGQNVAIAILIVPLLLHTFIDLGFGGWLKPDFILLAALAGIADRRRSRARGRAEIMRQVSVGP